MSNPIESIVLEVGNMINYLDRNVLAFLYNTWAKNILLIVLALYSIFFVKEVPDSLLKLTNRVDFRIFIAVVIVYVSRRHVDIAVLMILAFYFTLQRARGIRVMDSGELEVVEETDEISTGEPVREVAETEMPFQQAKNPADVRHPAHLREDMAVYDEENMNTCVAVSERDMCAGGLFNPMGYAADDFGNLADF